MSKRTIYRHIKTGLIESSGKPLRVVNLKIESALMKPTELTGIFKVSKATIYRWFDEGVLEGIRIGGSVRIYSHSVKGLLESGLI
jgi:excisionase family DNA binding protein